MKTIKIRATFTEAVLGTLPGNQELYLDYIATKAPNPSTIEDEVAALGVDGVAEKGVTVFPRTEDGKPFIYDYQLKGFFKDTCGMLRNVKGTESANLKAYKKYIDGLVFVSPRQIIINTDKPVTICQRPLRASTPMGERIAIAASEEIAAGATIEFTVDVFKDDMLDTVYEWLDYGRHRGLGAWRNSGKGAFTCEVID